MLLVTLGHIRLFLLFGRMYNFAHLWLGLRSFIKIPGDIFSKLQKLFLIMHVMSGSTIQIWADTIFRWLRSLCKYLLLSPFYMLHFKVFTIYCFFANCRSFSASISFLCNIFYFFILFFTTDVTSGRCVNKNTLSFCLYFFITVEFILIIKINYCNNLVNYNLNYEDFILFNKNKPMNWYLSPSKLKHLPLGTSI